jgi:hypothetical protein
MAIKSFRWHAVLVPAALGASVMTQAQQPAYQSAGYAPQSNYAPPPYPPPQPAYPTPANPPPPPVYATPAAIPQQPPPATVPAVSSGQGAAPSQVETFRSHEDTRHGHDQVYPDRGAILHELPKGASVFNFAGSTYWFADGIWLEPRGAAFSVIAPPIGLVVASLPASATAVVSAGRPYLYANDVYYRPRPDLGGYEVVNDPVEPASEPAAATAGTTSVGVAVMPVAATVANAPSPPVSAPVAAAPAAPVAPVMALAAAVAPTPSPSPAAPPSVDQQARDRYECYRFAVTQTGFDPLRTPTGPAAADIAQRQSAYERAQAACFEGRGYAVR